jgi:hypothetical protein
MLWAPIVSKRHRDKEQVVQKPSGKSHVVNQYMAIRRKYSKRACWIRIMLISSEAMYVVKDLFVVA